MKILVPSDFSVYAKYAMDAASEMLSRLGGELHLFHAQQIGKSVLNLANSEFKSRLVETLKAEAMEKLSLIKSDFDRLCDFETFIHYAQGDLVDRIKELDQDQRFDFVFMGSHGTTESGDWLIGSNTQKVVRVLHENVLVLKKPLKKVEFRRVLFATGLSQDDRQIFPLLMEILSPLGMEYMDILAVNATGFFQTPTTILRELLKEFEVIANESIPARSHQYHDFSVEAGIRHFLQEHPQDLIVMSNHVRKPLKRMFFGSTVEMIINQVDIPVLSIDF